MKGKMRNEAKIQNFGDLNAWQAAQRLVPLIFRVTRKFSKEGLYRLTSQVREVARGLGYIIPDGLEAYRGLVAVSVAVRRLIGGWGGVQVRLHGLRPVIRFLLFVDQWVAQ